LTTDCTVVIYLRMIIDIGRQLKDCFYLSSRTRSTHLGFFFSDRPWSFIR
jgi:hypothetical protein